MNKFFKAFATVTTISVATRALCFLFKIFLSRSLSLEMLGSYQIAMNIFMVFVAVVSSGIPITLSKEVSFETARGDNLLANKKTTAGLVIAMIGAVGAGVILLIFQMFLETDKSAFLQIMAFSLVFYGLHSVTRGYLWGKREFFTYSLLEFIEEVMTFAFAYIFLKVTIFDSDIQNVALAFVLASVGCGFLGLWAFFKKGGKIVFSKAQLGKVFKSSSFITVMRIVGTGFASLTTLCLPKFLVLAGYSEVASLEVVGKFYGMVTPLLFIPSTLVSALSLVLVPEVASFSQDKKQVSKTIGFAMQFAVLFASVFIPFFGVFGSEITSFLFANSEAGTLLQIACFAVLPISLNLLLSGFLNSLGLEKYNFIHFFISGILCFALLLPATKLLGEVGVVLIFAIQPTLPLILNLRTISKKICMKPSAILYNLAPALLCVPCFLIALLLKGVTAGVGAFLTLAISGIGIFLFCAAVFYALFYPFKAKS